MRTLHYIFLVVLLCWVTTASPNTRHRKQFLPLSKKPNANATADGQTATTSDSGELPGDSKPQSSNSTANSMPPISTNTPTPDRCTQPASIDTYMQISASHSPQADDKNGIYFISDLRDAPQIFHQSSPGAWPEQMTFFPDGVVYYRTSPDGKQLLVASHVGGDEQYDIYLLEPASKNRLTPLIEGRNKRVESVAWAPNGEWFAYTANTRSPADMDLHRFWVKARKIERLAELQGAHEVSDISPDGKWIAVTEFRSVTDSEILLFDTVKMKTVPFLKHDAPKAYTDAQFTGDSKSIFFVSDRDSNLREVLVKKLDGNLPAKRIASESSEAEYFTLSPKRNYIATAFNREGYSKMAGFEIDSVGNKIRNLVVPSNTESVIRSVAFSRKSASSFWYSETSSTATSDIWQMRSRPIQWTRSTQGQIHPDCFVREQLVHYPSFDGKSIPAFLYSPAGSQDAIPFIVFSHGGPESQSRPTFNRVFQYFLRRGFGVFAPNIRGSTGYGREYTLLDNYKQRMDSIRDTVEGAKWLLTQKIAKAGKMAIMGGSYGGFVVLRSIQMEPTLFAAASESVGITDFATFLANTKPYRRKLREVEYGPLSDEEFLKSISPMRYLASIQTPLLIFHGANDPRVPVTESQQIANELKKREVPVELVIFPDEGHGNAKLRNQLEQARKITAFFEKYFH